jgi:hypothetical protein
MLKLFLLILIGALAVSSAQSASIPITQLPYTIVTPGTYVFESDLFLPQNATAPAITINVNVPGKVLLNLNGHRLLSSETGFTLTPPVGIEILAGDDIYIENGSIGTIGIGFITSVSVNPNSNGIISNLELYGVTFNGAEWNVIFNRVNNSVVKNCSFNGMNGIADIDSQTGNKFLNNIYGGVVGVGISVTTRSWRDTPFDWKPTSD